MSSVVTIDSILPQPRFYQSFDIGTGPLYGDCVLSVRTSRLIEAACSEVSYRLAFLVGVAAADHTRSFSFSVARSSPWRLRVSVSRPSNPHD